MSVDPDMPLGGLTTLVSALRHKAPRAAIALAAGQSAWPSGRWAYKKIRARSTYTVKIDADDDAFEILGAWVLSVLPSDKQHALVAWTSRNYSFDDDADRSLAPRLRIRHDGSQEHVISFGGYRYTVCVEDSSGGDGHWTPPQLVFSATSFAAREALLTAMADALAASRLANHRPSLRMVDKHGGWTAVDELPVRAIGSVVLRKGQMDRLVGDIDRFLKSEQLYVRRGIPWHRGHLYEGSGGTGKTSTVLALANHFGLDLWNLSLADMAKDGELMRAVSTIRPRSMLVIEDIDVFRAAKDRDRQYGNLTLSGLLNSLDGIATPRGLITVLTTNQPMKLDPALMRAGRADLVEHFGNADETHVSELISHYYDCPVEVADGLTNVAPARVIEACKRHDDAESALRDLRMTELS